MLPRQALQFWNVDKAVPLGKYVILEVQAQAGKDAEVLVGRVRPVR